MHHPFLYSPKLKASELDRLCFPILLENREINDPSNQFYSLKGRKTEGIQEGPVCQTVVRTSELLMIKNVLNAWGSHYVLESLTDHINEKTVMILVVTLVFNSSLSCI